MGVLQTLRLGPNGELVLPTALRESLQLEPGDLVQIGVETPKRSSAVLKLQKQRIRLKNLVARQAMDSAAEKRALSDTGGSEIKHGLIDDLVGCIGYNGPSVSLEDMDAALGQAVAERRRNG